MCNYDLDDMDLRWLSAMNGERALMGATTISGTYIFQEIFSWNDNTNETCIKNSVICKMKYFYMKSAAY